MNCCTCVNSRTSFWYSSALATNIQSESIESNRSLMFCLSSTFYCRCPYLSLLITRRVIILRRMWRRRFKRLISSKIGSPQPFIASEERSFCSLSTFESRQKSFKNPIGRRRYQSIIDWPTNSNGWQESSRHSRQSFIRDTHRRTIFLLSIEEWRRFTAPKCFGWDESWSQC